jgi:hypothetical protein
MIEHIVLLKFSTETTEAQIDELIFRTKRLKGMIPGIIDIQQGRDFSNRNQGFEVGLTIRFEDRKALENFGPHPKHQEVLSYSKEIGLVDIIVVDFEMN